MSLSPQAVLVAAVLAVGFFHTLVPDHWVPIAMAARQFRWSRMRTARAAAIAGLGHTISTLAIGVVVWFGGVALATRYGNLVSLLAGIALVAFGAWIAIASLRELRSRPQGWESAESARFDRGGERKLSALLLVILGSSPMVEGIPAFFAAARFGSVLLAVMAVVFALSTIMTYVGLCVFSRELLAKLSLGPLERYGEVLSGTIIVIVGVLFFFWSPA